MNSQMVRSETTPADIDMHITGIDMSSAFDNINPKLLIEIPQDILDEDEMKMVRFPLSGTNISIKMKGATEEMPFFRNIATPRGDILSPVSFSCTWKELWEKLENLETQRKTYHQKGHVQMMSTFYIWWDTKISKKSVKSGNMENRRIYNHKQKEEQQICRLRKC